MPHLADGSRILTQEWSLKTCLILANGFNEVGCELDKVWSFGVVQVVKVRWA